MLIHRFSVSVNCNITDENIITDKVQDRECLYDDCGFLILPDSYSPAGTPTRLVFFCHGAGGSVSTDDAQTEHAVFTKYLVANGYAVVDVNGLPEEYSKEHGISLFNNIGSPISTRSYVKAYHYCIDNFNFKPDVFVFGGSMGGISSTNLVLSGCIPVIAHGALCPVLDTYNQIFKKPWSGGAPKVALGKIYNLDSDENGEYIYDEAKILGCNPAKNKKAERYPVPLKFWQCIDDEVVPYEVTKKFVDKIRSTGGNATLRTLPHGGHEPQLVGEPVDNPVGNIQFGDEVLEITPVVEEMFIWLRNLD